MDVWNDISLNAWLIAFMLFSITIPVLICMGIVRLFGKSVKKTVRVIRTK